MRGGNDGLYGGGARDVALPVFATLNRGGGFVTLFTMWSRGQRLPAPGAVLRVALRQLMPRYTLSPPPTGAEIVVAPLGPSDSLPPGSGAGRSLGVRRRVYGASRLAR